MTYRHKSHDRTMMRYNGGMGTFLKGKRWGDGFESRFWLYWGALALATALLICAIGPNDAVMAQAAATDLKTRQMWADFGQRLWRDRTLPSRSHRRLSKEEVEAMVRIAWLESRFDPDCKDPRSTAKGLWGFLDSTAKEYGGRSQDPLTQTRQAVRYVQDRYGTPSRALRFWRSHGWY